MSMSRRRNDLLVQALALPKAEWLALATELLDSLEGPERAGVPEPSLAELERRARDVHESRITGDDANAVLKRLRRSARGRP